MPLPPSWELWTLNPSLLSTLWPMLALESKAKKSLVGSAEEEKVLKH